MRLIRRGSLLGFPGGRNPGIDPTHAVLQFGGVLRLSAVAMGGNFINLLTGKAGTNTSSPTPSIDGFLGQGVSYSSGGMRTVFATGNAGDVAATIGAIVFFQGATGLSSGIVTYGSASNTGFSLQRNNSNLLCGSVGASGALSSGITPTDNTPWFVAASFNGASGVDYVAVNLSNGKLLTGSSASATLVAPNTTIYIGNESGLNQPTHGNIAAAMVSSQYIGKQGLLAWAADPWSFWYPRSADFILQGLGPQIASANVALLGAQQALMM